MKLRPPKIFMHQKKPPKAETKPNPRQEKIYYSFTSKRVFACDCERPGSCPYCAIFLHDK